MIRTTSKLEQQVPSVRRRARQSSGGQEWEAGPDPWEVGSQAGSHVREHGAGSARDVTRGITGTRGAAVWMGGGAGEPRGNEVGWGRDHLDTSGQLKYNSRGRQPWG